VFSFCFEVRIHSRSKWLSNHIKTYCRTLVLPSVRKGSP
ncbi:hypothetical protein TVAGG3_0822520, partial [Trichomonas vaginalis G3]